MKSIFHAFVCAFLVVSSLSGCVYSKIGAPLDVDLNNTELGTKVGRASTYSVLWLVAWGDEGISAAAKEGDLKLIRHADQEFFSILFGLYSKHTVIVYGD